MKRLFALFFLMTTSMSIACAEKISVDLETSSVDELTAARDKISARLTDIYTTALSDAEEGNDVRRVITGSGTKILDGFDVTVLSRFVASCDEDTRVTWYTDGNDMPSTYGEYGESQSSYAALIDKPTKITSIMVESQGNWEFEFSPIWAMGGPDVSGSGSYITDTFTVNPPCIVSITLTNTGKSLSNLCSISLRSIRTDGNLGYESMIDWGTRISGTQTFDVIIKPDNNVVSYFWSISCSDDVEWSITAK